MSLKVEYLSWWLSKIQNKRSGWVDTKMKGFTPTPWTTPKKEWTTSNPQFEKEWILGVEWILTPWYSIRNRINLNEFDLHSICTLHVIFVFILFFADCLSWELRICVIQAKRYKKTFCWEYRSVVIWHFSEIIGDFYSEKLNIQNQNIYSFCVNGALTNPLSTITAKNHRFRSN